MHQDAELLCASYENVLITFWWTGSPAILQRAAEQRRLFASQVNGPFGSFSIIQSNKLRRVTAEERQLMQELNKEFSSRMIAEATVLGANPLVLSMVRMLLGAINLVNRSRHPSQFFSSLDEANEWFCKQLNKEPTAFRAAIDVVLTTAQKARA